MQDSTRLASRTGAGARLQHALLHHLHVARLQAAERDGTESREHVEAGELLVPDPGPVAQVRSCADEPTGTIIA
jgi:hypothetical protein